MSRWCLVIEFEGTRESWDLDDTEQPASLLAALQGAKALAAFVDGEMVSMSFGTKRR